MLRLTCTFFIIIFPAFAIEDASSVDGYSYGYGGNRLLGFSGDMIVQTPLGPKRIDQLNVVDFVLTADNSMVIYYPVIMFLRKKPAEKVTLKQIQTYDGGIIKLAENQLIYFTSCNPDEPSELIHAKDLNLNQCLITFNENKLTLSKIANITDVSGIGIYAPLTASGTILVNNILSSCHSNMAVNNLQQPFVSLYRHVVFPVFVFLKSFLGINFCSRDISKGITSILNVINLFVPKYLF